MNKTIIPLKVIKNMDIQSDRRALDRRTPEDCYERNNVADLKDRLARVEQDLKNQKENFTNFKLEDFNALKIEVHGMRAELNSKIDTVLKTLSSFKDEARENITKINITMAKWMGSGAVVIFLVEVVIKKFI